MNTKDMILSEPTFTLMKGQPKTGKSIAAHSYPQPSYTLSFEPQRMRSIKSYYKGQDFEYDTFLDLITTNQCLDRLKVSCPYKTVIFDGMTKFSDLCIEKMIEHRMPNMKSDSKTVRAGIPMAEIEDYGGEYRALTMAMNSLLAINVVHKVHVIVIAHVIEVSTTNIINKTTTVTRELLTAGKKVAAKLPVDFNEVYHFYSNANMMTGGAEFYAVTKSNNIDWAATCMPLPGKIEWTDKNFYDEIKRCIAGSEFASL